MQNIKYGRKHHFMDTLHYELKWHVRKDLSASQHHKPNGAALDQHGSTCWSSLCPCMFSSSSPSSSSSASGKPLSMSVPSVQGHFYRDTGPCRPPCKTATACPPWLSVSTKHQCYVIPPRPTVVRCSEQQQQSLITGCLASLSPVCP